MGISRPGVLGVTPAASNIAACQADEKGTAARMDPFPLKRVKGFNNR